MIKFYKPAGIIPVGYFITKPAPPFEPLGCSSLNCIKIWGVTEAKEVSKSLITIGKVLQVLCEDISYNIHISYFKKNHLYILMVANKKRGDCIVKTKVFWCTVSSCYGNCCNSR